VDERDRDRRRADLEFGVAVKADGFEADAMTPWGACAISEIGRRLLVLATSKLAARRSDLAARADHSLRSLSGGRRIRTPRAV